MTKSLITGGAGFVGSHLADRLLADGDEVAVIDNLSSGNRENLDSRVGFYEMDIQDPKIVEIFAKEKPDFVFHLAAQIDVRKSVENPIEDAKINLLGTFNVLDSATKNGAKKVIFASSGGAVYGDTDIFPTPEIRCEQPLSPYGIHKLAAEKTLFFYKKVKGLDYTILRMSNIYGPRQSVKGEAGVIAIFINKMLKGEQPYITGDGNQTRDYVFVKDVTQALALAKNATKSDKFNIGTGVETSVNEIFERLAMDMNLDITKMYQDAKPGEQMRSCLEAARAKSELGWLPEYNIDRGVRETVQWFKDNE
ncbi:MAG: NAD-dependent epimerase/dehydratase family protein [Patescibacteria group bacterium]